MTVDAEDNNMVIDGEAYNSQTNGIDGGTTSELEPMNVDVVKSDIVREAQFSSSTNRVHYKKHIQVLGENVQTIWPPGGPGKL